jgi:hypothetical protein
MTKEEKILEMAAKVANVIFVATAGVSLALFAYIFYYYAWSGQRQILTSMGWVIYYGAPLCLFLVSIAAVRLKALYKIRVLIVCGSLAVPLYGSELLLRYQRANEIGPDAFLWVIPGGASEEQKREVKEMARSFGVDFDTRSRLDVIRDLEKSGIKAVPAVAPEMLRVEHGATIGSAIRIRGAQVLPLGGIGNRLTVLCNESGQYVTYESDERGFSNPRGIWNSRRLQIVAVGDSFTQGFCVPPDKTFVGLIRDRYPATLNLGMAGNGPLVELAGLEEYARDFRPSVVLWFYTENNDLRELQKEKRTPLLLQYLDGGFRQGLTGLQEDIDHALASFVANERQAQVSRRLRRAERGSDIIVTDRPLKFAKLSEVREKMGLVYGSTRKEEATLADLNGPTIDLFREILARAKNLTERWGGTLCFIYLPGWNPWVNRIGILEEKYHQVVAIVRELKIPVIDIREVFQRSPDPLTLFPFRASGHYNEAGHRLVAEEVLRMISKIAPDASPLNRPSGDA